MVPADNDRRSDQILSFEGGVDAGLPPALILRNQNAWAVNTTHRGGWPAPRPGIIRHSLGFGGDGALQNSATSGYFQGAGSYISDAGRAYIAMSVSGRIFTIDLTGGFLVRDITIPGDANMERLPRTWFQQAENWLVVQNSKNPPFLFNSVGSRRAAGDEVPVGGPMAYGKGRLWVARGNLLYGGDLVWSDPALGRNSVIKFTENEFLNEGGAFAIPGEPVTGLDFIANLDTGLGEHSLQVYSFSDVQGLTVPVDRTTWKNLEYPALTYVARDFGSVNDAIVRINGDHVYRSHDGIRSLAYARRDFAAWGNTPISRQIDRAMKYDTQQRLYACSGVNFDNRTLFTVGPQWNADHGMWHQGLVVLDYHLITGMGRKADPAWEGVWTGLRILQILTVKVGNVRRCFILALSATDRIELWELTRNRRFDFDGNDDVPIQWTVEPRQQSCGTPTEFKRLESLEMWLDEIAGDVSMQVFYRTDGGSCWNRWANWSACAPYRNCGETEVCGLYPNAEYQPIRNYQPQERPRQAIPQPQDVADPQTGGLTRDGYLFQVRLEMSGQMRLKMMDLIARARPMGPFGDMQNSDCVAQQEGACSTDCPPVECCPRTDYSYDISVEGGADNDDSYPVYPEYPVYPGDGGGGDGGGDGGDGGDGGGGGGGGDDGGDDEPAILYDPENPTAPPTVTGPCDGGEVIVVASYYVWGLLPNQNPNLMLTAEQLACSAQLLETYVVAVEQMWISSGYTVTRVSGKKWIYDGATNTQLAGVLKSTCDPFDGIDDHYILFGGYTYAAQSICVVPPA